jgi:hypothetical protein
LGGLRERERQISSAIAVIAVAAVVFVVVVDDGVDVNGCIVSASAPVVHVLPGQGRQRRASRGGKVFPRGQRRRQSNPNRVALPAAQRKTLRVHNAQSGPLTGKKKSLRRCGFTGSALKYMVGTFVTPLPPTSVWERLSHLCLCPQPHTVTVTVYVSKTPLLAVGN